MSPQQWEKRHLVGTVVLIGMSNTHEQSRWQAFVHSSLMPGVVGQAVLYLGHIKIKSNPGITTWEEEGRQRAVSSMPQSAAGEQCPQINPPPHGGSVHMHSPTYHQELQHGRKKAHRDLQAAIPPTVLPAGTKHRQATDTHLLEDVTQEPANCVASLHWEPPQCASRW